MSDYLESSRVLTVIASLFTTFGLYTQAWKIWRTKSAKDFTSSLIAALLTNEICWLNYGFAIKEWPIILICSLNIPAVVAGAAGYWHFRK